MAETETKLSFPKGFLLGAASSAHQVEGQNTNSDWWYWEQLGKLPKSGVAADHYNRFEEDFQMAQSMGLNAMRISIEWARIEPKEGQWSSEAIAHYKKVLQSMKAHGLTRVVTLWHWTLPKWFADKGGFESALGVEAFGRYAWFVAQNLGSEIDLWETLNEPETFSQQAYMLGKFPPFKTSNYSYLRVLRKLILAHKRAYGAIKAAYPEAKVGISKNFSYYEPFRKHNLLDRLIVFFADRIGNHYFLEKVSKQLDFIGLNYYFYNKVRFDFIWGYREMNLNFADRQLTSNDLINRSDMGWLLYPKGLYQLLLGLKRYQLPVYVTENGLADAPDSRRANFLQESLRWVAKALATGVSVKGYFYWALTDNYEWTNGFGPRFGLVEIDYPTQKRSVRKSAEIFKQVKIQT